MQRGKISSAVKKHLQYRYLPLILAAAGFVIMLPAVNSGLMMDDFIQGTIQLSPEQLPPRVYDTGIIPEDSGKLTTVLFELFGFSRSTQKLKIAKNYGILPWWIRDNAKAALWRPFTAFTHWLDYRLFPKHPALMHLHNIAWFAAVIFLVTVVYRRLLEPSWAAGLAAVLFLLDENTFFPVMFIANRGFIISLLFGLLCLYAHHKWRSKDSSLAAVFSLLFLALSLLSNEAGVSTFAFLLAYALFIEQDTLLAKLPTLLPSVLLIVLWRIIYTYLGYGVFGVGGYIDPGYEPIRFVTHLPARLLVLLSAQLSGQSPDILFAVNSSVQKTIITAFSVFLPVVLLVLFPLVRWNKSAQFWFAVMLFAAIPASAVTPASKNFGFVAVGAFGLIAVFVAVLANYPPWMPRSRFYKIPAWTICVILLLAHIPGAITSRIISSQMTPFAFGSFSRLADIGPSADTANRDVVVVNAPSQLALSMAPVYKAYHNQDIPQSLTTLSPGCVDLHITRSGDKTLVITSAPENIFSSDQRSPLHFSHMFNTLNLLFIGDRSFWKGEKENLENMTVEILVTDARQMPTEVAYHFVNSLDDPNLYWLQFDWHSFSYKPFDVPQIGQTVSVPGPAPVKFGDALRYAIKGGAGE